MSWSRWLAQRAEIPRPELGPVTGENVNVIGAKQWHDAGLTGAGVRVGIVDFFDLSLPHE